MLFVHDMCELVASFLHIAVFASILGLVEANIRRKRTKPCCRNYIIIGRDVTKKKCDLNVSSLELKLETCKPQEQCNLVSHRMS